MSTGLGRGGGNDSGSVDAIETLQSAVEQGDADVLAAVNAQTSAMKDAKVLAAVQAQTSAMKDSEVLAAVQAQTSAMKDSEVLAALQAQISTMKDSEVLAAVRSQTAAMKDAELLAAVKAVSADVISQTAVMNAGFQKLATAIQGLTDAVKASGEGGGGDGGASLQSISDDLKAAVKHLSGIESLLG